MHRSKAARHRAARHPAARARRGGLRPGSSRKWRRALAATLVLLALAASAAWWWVGGPAPEPADAAKTQRPGHAPLNYVGSAACAGCHRDQHDAWTRSHHAQAMQPAGESSVLADFGPAAAGLPDGRSTVSRRDGRFFVRVDGPGGRTGEHEVRYTVGVSPLQQYLIELPGGRLQAFDLAWDARPQAQGGQRWFAVSGDRKPGAAPHWGRAGRQARAGCPECHATNPRTGGQSASGDAQPWSEPGVGCEACHGPGSAHIAWARGEAAPQDRIKGLAVRLDERFGVVWAPGGAGAAPSRSRPHAGNREIETCAQCHSHRTRLSADHAAGRPLGDAFVPSLLEPGLYWPDGQMREAAFTYASFLQSRMHGPGVTCGDCHDAHAATLRIPGNGVCAQCHLASRYDTPQHHFHPAGSEGARCIACHMPRAAALALDSRHDHSIRVPRPDLSVRLGTPNACKGCHTDRTDEWAAAAIRRHHPDPRPGFQSFGEAFDAADRDRPGAQRRLLQVVRDPGQPGIVRASALSRLARRPDAIAAEFAAALLADPDVLVRIAAVRVLAVVPPAERPGLLAAALEDPVLAVRIAAGRALAGADPERLSAPQRAALARALDEYVAAQDANADLVESRIEVGRLYAENGRPHEAAAAFAQALALEPDSREAAQGLAAARRAAGAKPARPE